MENTRTYWLDTMLAIASPVLDALEKRTLKASLPLDFHPDRASFAPLEAFARTVCGMAPWLELDSLEGEEAVIRERFVQKVIAGIDAATDPASPDYMNWDTDMQPLVDAAHLAHGLLRAPRQLAGRLPKTVRENLVAALKKTRRIIPCWNNWILFTGMVEAGLMVLGETDIDMNRIGFSVENFRTNWYEGDGLYRDGETFSVDYYNSYVIQPMMVDLARLGMAIPELAERWANIFPRAQRCVAILERMISPEGTYPIVGRSAVYRFGAFQLLSQAALQGFLPSEVTPAQVRCALTAVIQRTMASPDMFDAEGWLTPGVYGRQPELADYYSNIGSLYLCSTVFLPLGLPPQAEFWSAEDEKWSAAKIWSGDKACKDGAYRE